MLLASGGKIESPLRGLALFAENAHTMMDNRQQVCHYLKANQKVMHVVLTRRPTVILPNVLRRLVAV